MRSPHRGHPARTTLALGLLLAITACRGSNPQPQEQTGPETDSVQAPATIALEWTDSDLEKSAERNAYGSTPEAILGRDGSGALVFTPQTVKDHVATRFARLESYDGNRSLELLLDVRTEGGDACVANVQDQAFNMILSAPCRSVGEQRATVELPKTVTEVRLYFQTPRREPVHLPARVRLIEHR